MRADRYYLTAQEAAEALGVSRATIYAYTSRGQLRSEPVAGRPKERRYDRGDVERLRDRQDARRDPSKAAARGLHWGGPVLESAITLIHGGRFYYRGRDAVQLAESWSAEQVAALLWAHDGIDERERARLFSQACPIAADRLARLRTSVRETRALMQVALPIAAASDLAAYDLRPASVRSTGARILWLLTTIIARRESHAPIHRALQAAWAPRQAAVAEVIRTALVLCADHELNVSAFTARCAASAGSCPYHVVSAAMATLMGYKHGGAAERVFTLAAGAQTVNAARSLLAQRLRRGEAIAGFGHPLYPSGDPRARSLLRLAEASGNESAWRPFRNLVKAGTDVLGDAPNLDCALAAVARTYRLPDQAPLLLFALGRTIGWIAHAIEEYASGELIRPRARYTGPGPQDGAQ